MRPFSHSGSDSRSRSGFCSVRGLLVIERADVFRGVMCGLVCGVCGGAQCVGMYVGSIGSIMRGGIRIGR